MTLPKKNSRTISVNDVHYRWLVSVHHGCLHLTIESEEDSGQTLQAFFEPHDQFIRSKDNNWTFSRQGRSITPNHVHRIIQHGLGNGWQPQVKGIKTMVIHIWEASKIVPEIIESEEHEVPLRDLATQQVSDLQFDLSLDPEWRKTLFSAPIFQRFIIPDDYYALSDQIRNCGLKFAVFNDGGTDCGFVVFGIESVDFPDVVAYTTNNPDII